MTQRTTSALITGSSRGLGLALATTLARRGAQVVMLARDNTALEAAVAAVRRAGSDAGGTAYGIAADIGDKGAIYRIAGEASALLGPIDLLIHNASTLGALPMPILADTECEDLERVLQVNVVGPFRLTKALAGAMALRGVGTIVHISSDAAVGAYPNWGAYGASKAALDHMNRTWASELPEVRFLSVDPGEMDTRMHADALPDADPSTLADPADVAERIVTILAAGERVESGARLRAADWDTSPMSARDGSEVRP